MGGGNLGKRKMSAGKKRRGKSMTEKGKKEKNMGTIKFYYYNFHVNERNPQETGRLLSSAGNSNLPVFSTCHF